MNYTRINNIENVFIAEGAILIGDICIEKNSSVWYNAVVRGDSDYIKVGEGSNIQDNSTIHVDENYPVTLGNYVTVGHGAVVHGCFIGDNSLIGMGAVILNGASIGKNCIIGAGALVPQNMKIPDGSLVYGTPAKIIRPLTSKEIQSNHKNAMEYVKISKEIMSATNSSPTR